jgi:hypothetical protein
VSPQSITVASSNRSVGAFDAVRSAQRPTAVIVSPSTRRNPSTTAELATPSHKRAVRKIVPATSADATHESASEAIGNCRQPSEPHDSEWPPLENAWWLTGDAAAGHGKLPSRVPSFCALCAVPRRHRALTRIPASPTVSSTGRPTGRPTGCRRPSGPLAATPGDAWSRRSRCGAHVAGVGARLAWYSRQVSQTTKTSKMVRRMSPMVKRTARR